MLTPDDISGTTTGGITVAMFNNAGSAMPSVDIARRVAAEVKKQRYARKAAVSARRLRALSSNDRQPIRAEMPNVNGDQKTAVLRIYDPIDSYGELWGVSAKEFATVIDDLPDTVEEIRLLVNSPGGEVTEGIAILNILRSHPARVVAVVEGVAASSASFIVAGADEVVMARNSEIFIHDAWGLCVGNATDMRQLADELDHLSNNIASVYAAKAGGSIEDWRALMAADTWLSADEAVAAGLADSVDEGTDASAADKAKARFDLSVFSGRREAPGPQHPVATRVGYPPSTEGGPAVAFSDEQIQHLRAALDVADDADEAAVFAALDDKLREYAEEPAPTTTPAPAPVATLPEGISAISTAVLTELTAKAELGEQARAEQIRSQRTTLVEAAVRDGRIAPAERESWLSKLEGTDPTVIDEHAARVLASLKPGLIPVEQLGTNGVADLDSDEAIFASLFGTQEAAR